MNKSELVEKILSHKELAECKKSQMELMLNETLSIIKSTVKKGQDVTLIGFGTFSKAKRKARMGRNPQTGKALKIPAMSVPKFKAGKDFKDLVR